MPYLRDVQVHRIQGQAGHGFLDSPYRRRAGPPQRLLRQVQMQGQRDVDNVTRTIWSVVRLRISQGKGSPSLARRATVTLAQEVSSPTAIKRVHLVSPSLPLCMFLPTVPSGA